MFDELRSYLINVTKSNISRLLSIQPPPGTGSNLGCEEVSAYLTNLGLILADRIDLIPDPELRTKLGFSERPQWPKQPETTPEQEQIKPEEEGEVTLDPRINVGELRVLLVREILQTTRLSDTDAREFATYLMEMGQFKSTLNISINEVFVFRKQLFDYLSSPLGEALQRTLRTIHMFEVLQKWVTERTADFKELLPEEKEKFDEEIRNFLMKALAQFVPEVNTRRDFVKFISEHPLFLETIAITAEIPVLTHFGQHRKTLQETVKATIHKLPMNQLFWEWKQSLNETPTDSIQPSPEVPDKTEMVIGSLSLSASKLTITVAQSGLIERVNEFLSDSSSKSAIATTSFGPTERYWKEEAVFRLVEVVGIPSQTANVVAEKLLRRFSGQEIKKRFESTLEVQRLFWIWVRSNYSLELFKRLSHIEVHEIKVEIQRLLCTNEAYLSVINNGLRIQNLSFPDLIYLLICSGLEGIPNGFHGDLHSLLSKFNFDALLDTWKRGASVF